METKTNYGSMGVSLDYGALTLTCAGEALAALLVSALVKSQLLALVSNSL